MGSDDQSQCIKGKRTKRQRSMSLFGFAVTDSSSSGTFGDDDDDDDYYYYNNSISFPTASTEEEEDMANCLIMLAQGDSRRGPKKLQEDNKKFSTVVTSNNNNNKAALCVYECKTCNRSFPSFQALGGHRASHKKPKATWSLDAEKKSTSSSSVLPPSKDDYSSENPVVHLQAAEAAINNNNKGNKIHECSICGSEFTSGQALGGHMRRHRAAVNNNSIVDVKPVAVTTRSIQPLDLNLPAPEDDHLFRFGTTQPSLVFSASALVDCHY